MLSASESRSNLLDGEHTNEAQAGKPPAPRSATLSPADDSGGSCLGRPDASGSSEAGTKVAAAPVSESAGAEWNSRGSGERELGRTLPVPFRYSPPTPPQSLYPASRGGRRDRLPGADEEGGAHDHPSHASRVSRRSWGDERLADRYGDRFGDRLNERLEGTPGERFERRPPPRQASRSPAHEDRARSDSLQREKRDGSGSGGRGEPVQDGENDADGEGNGRVAQLAEGLLWVQKHPVLAAVVWMFGKVLAPGSEEERREDGSSEKDDPGEGGDPRPPRDVPGRGRSSDSGVSIEGDGSVLRGLSRKQSKGRLSWSDDYGGRLAEYYEDNRDVSEELAPFSGKGVGDASGRGGREYADGAGLEGVALRAIRNAKGSGSPDLVCSSPRGAGGGGRLAEGGARTAQHSNVFYTDMVDAMRGHHDGTIAMSPLRGGLGYPTGLVAPDVPAAAGTAAATGKPAGAPCDKGLDDAAGILPRLSQLPSNGGGLNPQHTGPGTWSPQWGWYVSMTPPQEVYPTHQPSVAAPRAPTLSTIDGVNGQSPTSGRPPRP